MKKRMGRTGGEAAHELIKCYGKSKAVRHKSVLGEAQVMQAGVAQVYQVCLSNSFFVVRAPSEGMKVEGG